MWIMKFYSFNLDLDPMTLALKLDLDIIKMYVYTKNEVLSFSGSKVIMWTDTQTDWLKLLPTAYVGGIMRMVKIDMTLLCQSNILRTGSCY